MVSQVALIVCDPIVLDDENRNFAGH